MDLSILNLGEWMEEKVLWNGKEQIIKLKLKFISLEESIEIKESQNNLMIVKMVSDAIVGWNLNDGKKNIPCNPETKKRYVSFLMQLPLFGDPERTLSRSIMTFSVDAKNFSKN